ncbi:MAG: cytochrome C oxidase subunit IV family protein [Rhodospirillales bacterium]|nr:cytochrome C oxidase subunit IV family protein [Rhodospirillales bacterium]MCW8951534.1 cytochrome C oxidase subunit IV family protein [Rhodospirillales bacterium]MCW9002870.1 cytochrome C oxidase subunit IV family protein [Rhodospirillales bacterium]
MRFPLPDKKLLIASWLLLLALTVASMISGRASAGDLTPIGGFGMALVLAATALKAQQILYVYLNLRQSTAGWRAFFIAFLIVVCSGIALTYAIPPLS